jgi:LysM repeat protein
MRKLAALCLLLYCLSANASTGDSLNYLTPKDTIFLSIGAYGEKYFTHEMAPKQTLYSLARFYGLSVGELQYFNQGLTPSTVRVGTPVRVPVPNRAIRRYQDAEFLAQEHVPVFYVVKKGDTMYRIAKQHFKMPIEDIMYRNQLMDHTLKSGQKLHVGWLNIHGIPDSLRHVVSGPLEKKNARLRQAYLDELGGKRELEHQGVAAWQTNSKEKSDFYALHRYAPVNSIISVNNPMSRRTVYVRVIGRVPVTAYEPEVIVILSPLAAELLGAIDPRFFVRVKYHR